MQMSEAGLSFVIQVVSSGILGTYSCNSSAEWLVPNRLYVAPPEFDAIALAQHLFPPGHGGVNQPRVVDEWRASIRRRRRTVEIETAAGALVTDRARLSEEEPRRAHSLPNHRTHLKRVASQPACPSVRRAADPGWRVRQG
jgi:hypothetical protein